MPDVPAHQWHLSEAGREKCSTLAERLAEYQPDVVVTSDEPKAAETAHIVANILGKPVKTVDGLREHDRSNVPFLSAEDFEAAIAEFFREPQRLVLGQETADQAHLRFAGAVDRIVADHANKTVVLVTHGTVIALYVSRTSALDPFLVWKRLDAPSFVVLSLPERRILTIVESI